jgi:hypothetical protein
MGKRGNSNLGLVALIVGGALAYNFARQGQNTVATLITGRLANFRPLRLNGFNLECETQVLFTNTHPTRATQLQSLGLTISSASGVIIGTVHQPNPQTLGPNTTTAVKLPVSIELTPLLLQVIDLTALPALLRSFTGAGSALSWLAHQAGLRNCVLAGTAQVDGLIVPLRQVVDLGIFAPVATVTKLTKKSKPVARGTTFAKKVTA